MTVLYKAFQSNTPVYKQIPLSEITIDKLVYPITTLTETTILTSANVIVFCNGTFTVTLPSASDIAGQSFKIKNIGTGTITIASIDHIDGEDTFVMDAQNSAVEIISNGTGWFIF